MLDKSYKKLLAVLAIITALGTLAGNINNIHDFFSQTLPSKSQAQKLYGIWYGDYSYPISGGRLAVKGTTEYFKNNKYNFIGEIAVTAEKGGHSVKVRYDVDGTGLWQVDEQSLTVTLGQLRSVVKDASYDGHPLDIQAWTQATGQQLAGLDQAMVKDMSDDFTILSLTERRLELASDAPKGGKLTLAMTRRDQVFSH